LRHRRVQGRSNRVAGFGRNQLRRTNKTDRNRAKKCASSHGDIRRTFAYRVQQPIRCEIGTPVCRNGFAAEDYLLGGTTLIGPGRLPYVHFITKFSATCASTTACCRSTAGASLAAVSVKNPCVALPANSDLASLSFSVTPGGSVLA